MLLRSAGLAALSFAIVACDRSPDVHQSKPAAAVDKAEPRIEVPREPAPTPAPRPEEPSCAERIARALEEPALPGTPALDAIRTELFANLKAEPVLFVTKPSLDPDASATARAHAELIERTKYPWGVVERLLRTLASDPALVRQAILRDGYVFAETTRLALAYYAHLSLHHLFDEPRVWVQRGERIRWAVRRKDRYVWESGADEGRPARLLVFDRVGTTEPGPALHRDLRSLRLRLHFERVKVRHLGERSIVLDLRYGNWWIPTLLRSEGARLELECEAVPDRAAAELGVLRELGARRERALFGLRKAMVDQIEEELRFDEPKDEIGQQDGHLRFEWQAAYLAGRRKYKFNDHEYRVFDRNGRPAPPQVCVDFLVDTIERAAGTWWRPRGEPPGRTIGRFAFDDADRRGLRSTRRFIEFAREKSDWFDVRVTPQRERIEIGRLQRLTRYIAKRADDYAAGDMVIIHGYTPWDEEERHYHSFFIYDSDPVTGFPLALVGNAGRPRMWVLRTEANRTPKRHIVARIRPRVEWLESIVQLPERDEELTPAPLVTDGSGV